MRFERMFAYRLIQILRFTIPLAVIALLAILAQNFIQRRPLLAPGQDQAPDLPQELSVRSKEFHYEQKEGGRTVFTIDAQTSLGYKDATRLLQNVAVTIFGEKDGDPVTHIASDACSFDERTNNIRFTGNVDGQFDEKTRGRTQDLSYNHGNHVFTSTQRITIDRVGAATIEANAMEYMKDTGLVKFDGEVRGRTSSGGMLESGAALFQSKDNWARMADGAYLESATGWVRGQTVRADLEAESYRPKTIDVDGSVTGESRNSTTLERWNLKKANSLWASMSPMGEPEKVLARGNVRVEKTSETQPQTLTGDEVEANAVDGKVQTVVARATSKDPAQMILGANRTLSSDRIAIDEKGTVVTEDRSVLEFGDSKINGRQFTVAQADNLTFNTAFPATLVSGTRQSEANRTEARIDAKANQLIDLTQTGNFKFKDGAREGSADRAVTGEGGKESTLYGNVNFKDGTREVSADRAVMGEGGKQSTLYGNVKFKEGTLKGSTDRLVTTEGGKTELFGHVIFDDGPRHGSANNATMTDSGNIIILDGNPFLRDPEKKLDSLQAARRIELDQRKNTFRAEEKVVMVSQQASGPVRIVADRADGNADRVDFNGAVTLWQDKLSIGSTGLQLFTKDNHLIAKGNVKSNMDGTRVSSEELDYNDTTKRAVYTRNITVNKKDLVLHAADRLVATLVNDALSDATADGQVKMIQGGREGTGDRAVYDEAKNQVTLIQLFKSPARVKDQGQGDVEGARLTVALDGGKVVVESGETGRATSTIKVKP